MNLKFHLQHDRVPRLQTGKIQSGRESEMTINTKNSKTIKINFLSRKKIYSLIDDIIKKVQRTRAITLSQFLFSSCSKQVMSLFKQYKAILP